MAAQRVQKPRDPARRQRILEAAKRHFTAHGFKGTNLDAVAADAGCAKGALYLEFADKEALLREVVEGAFAVIRARYADEVLAIDSPLERLVATLRFAYRQLAADPMFGKLLREDPDLRALGLAADPRNIEAAKAQTDQIRGWVDEGIARGEIRADVDREAVPFVLGVLRFAPQHLGIMAELGLFSPERTLEAIVDLFRAGLAAPPSPPPTRRVRRTPTRRSKR
ncbi:TetR/AcrR family transcriptional regulator [Polyangium aurulentum]|uniref:TetR/AcrR family transcriptional regulator n=1 Tax=Polyangium aurulentum TaxID=2567896 RepID=UPI0010AE379C|nr:TetR/AcrR family transcriptional regulator [Polyangium aurulentum]UQA57980.1 TetR/AcrR family transcriptional regulator [Polyangium aurulentum]